MKVAFDNAYVSATVDILYNSDIITITGSLKNSGHVGKAELVAAAPPDSMANYTGSAQPFPTSEIAFENTPNRHIIKSADFTTNFKYPNSFYTEGGYEKVVSSVFVVIKDGGREDISRIALPDKNVLRSLTYRDVDTLGDGIGRTKGPAFYDREAVLPIPMTQYDQLMNIGRDKELYNIA